MLDAMLIEQEKFSTKQTTKQASKVRRHKRSVEVSESLTDVESDEEAPVEEELANQTVRPTFTQRTLPTPPSSISPASIITLPTAYPSPLPVRTLPTGVRVEAFTRTISFSSRRFTSSRTLPSSQVLTSPSPSSNPNITRSSVSPSTVPTARPSLVNRRTFPSLSRFRPRAGLTRVIPPSSFRRFSSLPRRTPPTRRVYLSQFRATAPPEPLRISSLSRLPQRRPLPARRTLPQPFRNPNPANARTRFPEPSVGTQRGIPTSRTLLNRFQSRVLPTPPTRQFSFIYLDDAQSPKHRGYDGTVVGCPTMSGNFSVTSMSRTGFVGVFLFPALEEEMSQGLMIKMKFPIPLKDLSSEGFMKVSCGSIRPSRREYCFVPQNPVSVIEKDRVR